MRLNPIDEYVGAQEARQALKILFHKDCISLLDHLQERFGLKSREAVLTEAVKLLAVADKNPLFVFRDEFIEVEIGSGLDER